MAIPWNELAIWWNEVSQGWNEMVWNEMVMETGHDRVRVRRAHQSSACLCEFIRYFGSFLWLNLKKGRIE